jgi:hypothetical protein
LRVDVALSQRFYRGEFAGSVVVCGTAVSGEPMKASEIAKWTDLSEEEINRMGQEVPEVDKKRWLKSQTQTHSSKKSIQIHKGWWNQKGYQQVMPF